MLYKNLDITWLGHSGFSIKSSGKIVYIDPYKISEESEKADFIFITHSHYDHCSIEDIQKIAKDGTIVICTADSSSKMGHIDKKIDIKIIEPEKQMVFDKDKIRFWTIRSYNLAKNFHERAEDWVGYVLNLDGVLIYHAGDTDLIPEMKSLSTANIDIALLPVGGTYTMNAGGAAKAAGIIKPKLALPMHFGAIPDVGTHKDAEIFVKLCSAEGVDARVLNLDN